MTVHKMSGQLKTSGSASLPQILTLPLAIMSSSLNNDPVTSPLAGNTPLVVDDDDGPVRSSPNFILHAIQFLSVPVHRLSSRIFVPTLVTCSKMLSTPRQLSVSCKSFLHFGFRLARGAGAH